MSLPLRQLLARSGKRFYCVCSTVGSGSTMLCRDLTASGAGAPTELFRADAIGWTNEKHIDKYVLHLVDNSPGDVFGFQITWAQAVCLARALRTAGVQISGVDLRDIFPDLRIIHFTRGNELLQAVSSWRDAVDSVEQWPGHDADGGLAHHPTYDFEGILNSLTECMTERWLWDQHFEYRGVDPYRIRYEDYVAHRHLRLIEMLRFLDHDTTLQRLDDHLRVVHAAWIDDLAATFTRDLGIIDPDLPSLGRAAGLTDGHRARSLRGRMRLRRGLHRRADK